MAKQQMNCVVPFFAVLMCLLSFNTGGNMKLVNGEKTWCVAKPSSEQAALLANLDYACRYGNCDIVNEGKGCFLPNNIINHASVAMNIYYQAMGRNKWDCHFNNSGLIVVTDPSYDNCMYA